MRTSVKRWRSTADSSGRPLGDADRHDETYAGVTSVSTIAKNGTKIKTEITIMKRIKIKTKIKIRRKSKRDSDPGNLRARIVSAATLLPRQVLSVKSQQ